MSSDLKRLVGELERVLMERGGSLDAPARAEFRARIDDLKKKAIDDGDAAQRARLRAEALNVLAALLSIVTNVMTLLK